MYLPRTFYRLFSVKTGEEKVVGLLFLLSFLLGISTVFYETSAYSLFLHRFDATMLPYVYIGASVLIILSGSGYAWLEQRLTFIRLQAITLGGLGGGVTLLAMAHHWHPGDWLTILIALWSEVILMLTGLAFWGLSGRLLTLLQAKRLFSLTSTGEVVARMVGGASISLLITLVNTSDLLFFVAASFGGCVAVLYVIAKHFPEQVARTALERGDAEIDEDDEERGLQTVARAPTHWRTRYMVLFTGLAGFSLIGYYFVDFIFYQNAEQLYPDDESLAGFLGLFFAAVGAVNLAFKTLLAGRLLNRFGMNFGLLFLPVSLLVGSFLAYWADFLSLEMGLVFGFIALIKLLDGVARIAVDEPSIVILYQPLPVEFRLSAQTRIESIGEPIAAIIASLLLLLLGSLGATSILVMLVLLISVLGVWIFVALLMRREYWEMLGKALSKRTLGDGVSIGLDNHSLDVLTQHLNSPHVGEVLYLANLLEQEDHQLFKEALRTLLLRPEPEIRLDALERIERHNLTPLTEPVRRLLATESEPKVRGAALRTYTAIAEEDIFDEIVPYLDYPRPEIRDSALVGLLRSGGIEGVLLAGKRFYELINSPTPEQRVLAAQILGDVGIRSFYRPLIKLFEDPHPRVRKAAILAAGKLGNPRLWSHVLESLKINQLRRTAEQALGGSGGSAVAEMRRFYHQPGQEYNVRLSLLRVCGMLCGEEASRLAFEALSYDEQYFRMQALMSLNRCHYRATTDDDRASLVLVAELELDNAAWILVTARDLQLHGGYPLLLRDLRTKMNQIQQRIFLLLGLILPHKEVGALRKNFFSDSREKRAYAVEMLNKTLKGAGLGRVFVLFDDINDHERLQRLLKEYPYQSIPPEQHLSEIISGQRRSVSFWTQCIALHEVGRKRLQQLYPAVMQALESHNKFVRETAVWALGQMRPETLRKTIEPLLDDAEPNVRAMTRLIFQRIDTDEEPR